MIDYELYCRIKNLRDKDRLTILQIARELAHGDARNLEPAEHPGFRAHTAHPGQRQQGIAVRVQNRAGVETHLRAQAFEHGRAPFVRQQVAGVLPHHQFERPLGGRQLRLSVMAL